MKIFNPEGDQLDNHELSLKLFVVMSKAYKAVMDQAMKDMKSYKLSPTEFTILELLYHKGTFPLQKIGDHILLTSGSITYNVDKLEAKGYLKRVPSSIDRRVITAELTDEGRQFFATIFPKHAELIHSLMDTLSEAQKQETIENLKKLGHAVLIRNNK